MGDRGMIQEFKAFLTKSNALALAIAFIIGAAMGKVVTALTNDLLMPVIGIILPKGDWREAQFVLSRGLDAKHQPTVNAIKYGDFMGSVVDFVVIAFIIFIITKALIKEAPAPPTKDCPFCKETVPAEATKCKACASALA